MTSTLAVLVLVVLGVIAMARARREDRRFTLASWPPKLPANPEPPPPTVYFVEETWDAGGIARRYPRSIIVSELQRAKRSGHDRVVITVCDGRGATAVRNGPLAEMLDDAFATLERWERET